MYLGLVDGWLCQGDICPGTLEPISKLFLVLYAVFGMGFFCGPMLEFASSWRHKELITAATVALGLGVSLFTAFEGSTQSEALYASVITGRRESSSVALQIFVAFLPFSESLLLFQ